MIHLYYIFFVMNNSIEIHNREVKSVNHLMVDGTEHKAGDDDDAR